MSVCGVELHQLVVSSIDNDHIIFLTFLCANSTLNPSLSIQQISNILSCIVTFKDHKSNSRLCHTWNFAFRLFEHGSELHIYVLVFPLNSFVFDARKLFDPITHKIFGSVFVCSQSTESRSLLQRQRHPCNSMCKVITYNRALGLNIIGIYAIAGNFKYNFRFCMEKEKIPHNHISSTAAAGTTTTTKLLGSQIMQLRGKMYICSVRKRPCL